MTKIDELVKYTKSVPKTYSKFAKDIERVSELLRDRIIHSSVEYIGACPISAEDPNLCFQVTVSYNPFETHYYRLSDILPLLSESKRIRVETIMKKGLEEI